ncbi:MAG TPA: hypothetical protein VMF52_14860 [Steroidobacteraceae bacterium]|nr:hypothetical protein [Steroidobacteraceae bacterium]
MARTFDIRFARSSGIAAVLESPANTFRLRGSGSLSIEGDAIEIEPRRGLLSLLARRVRVRISAAHLREVSRDGDSLRIEYGMPGYRRIVLPFWVRDRETAVEIMKLVPTRRTIERDEPENRVVVRRRGNSPTLLVLVALVSLTAGIIVTALIENHREANAEAALLIEEDPQDPASMAAKTPATPVVTNGVEAAPITSADSSGARRSAARPTPRDAARSIGDTYLPDDAYAATETDAWNPGVSGPAAPVTPLPATPVDIMAEARHFYREAATLRSEAIYGNTSARELEGRWWELTVRLYNSPAFDAQPRHPLVDAELGLSLNWRVSLANYADAKRSGDRDRIEAARADLDRADQLTDELQFFMR